MTEAEWLISTDPARMLHHIRSLRGERLRHRQHIWFADYKQDLAPRKIRLFYLACCRSICERNTDPACREVLQFLEQYVETPPPTRHREEVLSMLRGRLAPGPDASAITAAVYLPLGLAATSLRFSMGLRLLPAEAAAQDKNAVQRAALQAGAKIQCEFLRDIYGNPFRPLPPRTGKRRWQEQWQAYLARNNAAARKLAQSLYDVRPFDRLPQLGDALERGGCDDTDILQHCRRPGAHMRGCWVVDLILGKE